MTTTPPRSLDEQRAEFASYRYLAMPIAGTIAWLVAGVCGAFLPIDMAAWALFIATGSIFGLGVVIVVIYLVTIFVLIKRPRTVTP